MESYFIGFDPVTLDERYDVIAAKLRLDEIEGLHSTAALAEKIGLLRVTGRDDEAREATTEAMRQARLAGDRESIAKVKVARAQLLRAEGKHEQVIRDLGEVIAEAEGNGWLGIVADARRYRALARVALGEDAAAREDFNEALAVLVRDNAEPREIDATMIAVGVLLDRVGG